MTALDSYWRLTTPNPTRSQTHTTRHIITQQWWRVRNNRPATTDDTPECSVTVDWDDLNVYKPLGNTAYTTVLDELQQRIIRYLLSLHENVQATSYNPHGPRQPALRPGASLIGAAHALHTRIAVSLGDHPGLLSDGTTAGWVITTIEPGIVLRTFRPNQEELNKITAAAHTLPEKLPTPRYRKAMGAISTEYRHTGQSLWRAPFPIDPYGYIGIEVSEEIAERTTPHVLRPLTHAMIPLTTALPDQEQP
ncbi:hypothetical protein [Nocardiopsis alba]|uniref:hypothetical protein n=1 Tax=Nocardiopsis alba TaxID=53437 RepID=UPI0033B316D5